MLVFDKSVTLFDKLKEYDKESLKLYGSDLGLTKLSKFRKDELVQKVVDKLLDLDVMFYRGAILSDKQIAVLERGFNGPTSYSEDESDDIGTLNEMDFIIVSRDEYVVPCDVVKAWKKTKDEQFLAYQKRASWVWKCLYWTEEMYACTPIDIMLQVVNIKKDMQFDQAEVIEIFNHFPEDHSWSILLHNTFISTVYAGNADALQNIRYEQADKEFYIPTAEEVDEFYETGALISAKEYQYMQSFIMKEFGFSKGEAEDLLLDLWDRVSTYDDPHGTMQWFFNQFEFENDKQFEKIAELYMPIANSTRMLVNRGNKPSELMTKCRFDSNKASVITAGSSHAADMLKQLGPKLQEMGFNVDLDSNADHIPVMGFPNGLDGKTEIKEKKIYPNDPCPCGSGKKYKKCCGK